MHCSKACPYRGNVMSSVVRTGCGRELDVSRPRPHRYTPTPDIPHGTHGDPHRHLHPQTPHVAHTHRYIHSPDTETDTHVHTEYTQIPTPPLRDTQIHTYTDTHTPRHTYRYTHVHRYIQPPQTHTGTRNRYTLPHRQTLDTHRHLHPQASHVTHTQIHTPPRYTQVHTDTYTSRYPM